MPPSRKALTVLVPPWVAEEIEDAARRVQRSTAFIIRRALGAGPHLHAAIDSPDRYELVIQSDDEDAPDTLARIKGHGAERPLAEVITAAWQATRARFHAWIAREEDAQKAERADDLDRGLADTKAPGTSPERLSELSTSEYPRVRVLVAAHLSATLAVLEKLSVDRERTVRAAVIENPNTPPDLRKRIKV